jgi:hypothetical protein
MRAKNMIIVAFYGRLARFVVNLEKNERNFIGREFPFETMWKNM